MKHVVLPNTDCCTQACCCLHQVWSHSEAAFCSFVSWHCNLRRMNLFGSSYCIFQGSSREVAAATVPWCQDDCYLSLQARTTWIRETITYSISKTVDSHLHKHLLRPADFLHLWLSVPWRSKAHLPRSFCSSADTEISVITIKQKPQVPRVEG